MTFADVRSLARSHGFTVVGTAGGDVLAEALARLETWCAAGHAADLGWMTRHPPQRADPRTLLSSARGLLSVAVPYGGPPESSAPDPRFGRVARYAWGRDYHEVLLPRLDALGSELARRLGARRWRTACDHSPLLERAAAVRAGLGFFGKKTCLLRPREGSWFLLGEVLLDVEIPDDPDARPVPPDAPHGCGACRRCLVACPTDAFAAPFTLDARRCVSYWTIESRGVVPRELRERFGAWVFGCDACQDVCPYNGPDAPPAWPELSSAAGVGPRLDLVETLALGDDEAFARRFAGTSLLRPGRAGLLRNAAITARNVGAAAAVPVLAERLAHDPEPLVRAHALWALAGLDPARARPRAAAALRDPSPWVVDEARAQLPA
jgi:epoxyqueuosine reductase